MVNLNTVAATTCLQSRGSTPPPRPLPQS